jgi:ribose transport system substrate-binding protein
VATYVSTGQGLGPDAVAVAVQPDICQAGKEMAKATRQAIGASGPVAFFSGTPGNPQDAGWTKCAADAGIKSTFKADTNWTPAGTFQAASGLISSGKNVKAILYSYSNPVPQIIKAYKQANKPIPAIVTWTQDNGTSCLWKKDQAGKDKWKLYQTNALNWPARVATTAALMKQSGKQVPAQLIYPQPYVAAKPTQCDSSLPADYPGKSALIPDYLTKKLIG